MKRTLTGKLLDGLASLVAPIALDIILVLAISQAATAGVTGTILGVVTDSSNAVLPGTEVSLKNGTIGLTRTTRTDSDGLYQFLDVPVASDYSIEVVANGFSKVVQTNVTLLVNQNYRADFRLQIGSVNETLSVSGNPIQVETTSAQLGGVIESGKMQALPLNGRNYLELLALQVGVSPVGVDVGHNQAVTTDFRAGNLSVNGQREDANTFMINGATAQEYESNGAGTVPVLDSIEEFRVLTNSFSAEYGQYAGAMVNVVTKSGSNSYHGSIFEFLRNEKLDARNFFAQDQTDPVTGAVLPGTGRGVFKQNQFGATFGGPIVKDRLFFFGAYQGTRQVIGSSSGVITVPSLAERAGDFSDVTTTGFNPLTGVVHGDTSSNAFPATLSSRLGYTVNPGEPYWVPGCDTQADASAGTCVFPGQVIPKSAFSSPAEKLLGFFPNPVGSLSGQPFFTTSSEATRFNDDRFGIHVDWNNKLTGSWMFYYDLDDASIVDPFGGGNIPGFSSTRTERAQLATLSNTHVFDPSRVNDFRISWDRVTLPGNTPVGGKGSVNSFGFQEGGLGIIPVLPAVEGVPHVSLAQLGISFGSPFPFRTLSNGSEVRDDFSWILGKHTMKFGGFFGFYKWVSVLSSAPNGQFGFAGGETGNDFADFLIGAPDSFVQSSVVGVDGRRKAGAVYAQDSYKLKQNLTVNLGLRWSYIQPWYDVHGGLQAFIPGEQSVLFPDSPTGWVFPGDPGIPSTLAPTPGNIFDPRFGLAYSPGFSDGVLGKIFGGPGKSSIRAGFGIFHTSFSTRGQSIEGGDAPFGIFYVSPTPIYFDEPFRSRVSPSNPGQRFPYVAVSQGSDGLAASNPNLSFAPFLPIAGSPGYLTTNGVPYTEDFNFTIERQLSRTTLLAVSYVGSQGHRLFSQIPFNPGSAQHCLQIAALFAAAGQAGQGCGPFGEDTIYTINGQTFNGTRPFSVTSGRYLSQGLLDFGDNTWDATIANSNYNALQVTLDKRAGPVRFLAAYAYAKSIDDASKFDELVNPFNPRLSRGLSAFDITHNFTLSYSWDLPFQHLTSKTNGVLHKVLDGWQLSGITRFTTGVPVNIRESGDQSLCGCGPAEGEQDPVNLPDFSGGVPAIKDPRDTPTHQYFATSGFSLQPLGVGGTARRRFFHGPGLNNFDVALQKMTRINERFAVEFRFEFFNAFNHTQFMNPSGNFSASNFGSVTSARDPRIGQVALKVIF